MAKDNDREYLNTLVGLGLSMREAKIYLGLLTRHEFSANEIAKLTKLSRPATYDLLSKMVRLGICQEKPGKVKKFQAVSPRIALPRLVENKTIELQSIIESNRNKIDQLAPALDELFTQSRGQNDPLDYFEVLRDRAQIAQRFLELQKNVKEEMLTFVKPPFSVSSEANAENRVHTVTRGVIMKTISEYNGNYEDTVEYFSRPNLPGEEKRIAKKLPAKMIIFDSKISLLALNDPITGKVAMTTLYIIHRDFALMLREVFESFWSKAFTAEQLMKDRSLVE
jgi:HTH-type transcriptional regulator, sugar sensing transcriptional regulator